MIACADEPAMLSGFRQPMAKTAMVVEATRDGREGRRADRRTSRTKGR